jgi:hypothetical protein
MLEVKKRAIRKDIYRNSDKEQKRKKVTKTEKETEEETES